LKINIIAENITSDVSTAIWISTLINTYVNFNFTKSENFWISQRDIQETARRLCYKNIDSARISQWCNGDHKNNTYNYLRAKGKLRRLTIKNEFDGFREMPHELPLDEVIFENSDMKLLDLYSWYENIYCNFDIDVYTNEALEDANHNKSEINSTYDINTRVIEAIKLAWNIFTKKVGGGIIQINKEASMQLHFGFILQQVAPLTIYQDDEKIDIELETSIFDGHKMRNVDIMIIVYKGSEIFRIALELKCYKKKASSGKERGATDIFMKDVYQDLHLLERYCENKGAEYGIAFVMTDHRYFVHAEKKNAKCWDYDTTHGTTTRRGNYNTPIGGRPVDITLNNQYQFDWSAEGDYYFALLEKLST